MKSRANSNDLSALAPLERRSQRVDDVIIRRRFPETWLAANATTKYVLAD